jgi:hypothetical protein
LRQKVSDGVVHRLIGKWLNAGVSEGGDVHYPEAGTPQGGVISPLLSNVYLHEVLDVWFERVVKPRLRGRAFLIRFADDATLVFERDDDARRVMTVLPKRFERFGLSLHPEKTRLIPFSRPDRPSSEGPGSFDILGFTHYWARSRKGAWIVKRKTAKSRFTRALRNISDWIRRNRHAPMVEQQLGLGAKLRGHYAYFGITGNSGALVRMGHLVRRIWKKWLGRRNSRRLNWETAAALLKRYPLPPPIAVHSVLRRSANP